MVQKHLFLAFLLVSLLPISICAPTGNSPDALESETLQKLLDMILDEQNADVNCMTKIKHVAAGNEDGEDIKGTNDLDICGLRGDSKKEVVLKLLEDLYGGAKTADKITAKKTLHKIIGGEVAGRNEWPFQAFIIVPTGKEDESGGCGGTLISDQWILTAAHCFERENTQREKYMPSEINACLLDVTLSDFNNAIPDGEIQVKVSEVVVHSSYDPKDLDTTNDIALLRLTKPVSFGNVAALSTVCLPEDAWTSFDIGTKCWSIGWGKTTDGSDQPSKVLRKVELDLVEMTNCKLDNPDNGDLFICAGVLVGGKDTCQGDSGGPLLCEVDGYYYQVGVVSSSKHEKCAQAGAAGLYTNVATFLPWIETVVNQS